MPDLTDIFRLGKQKGGMSPGKFGVIQDRNPFYRPKPPDLVNHPSDTDYNKLAESQKEPEVIFDIRERPNYYKDPEDIEQPTPEDVKTELTPEREYSFSYQDKDNRKYDSGLQALQSQLYHIQGGKYFPGNGEDVQGDGFFGDNTATAIKQFAADHGIDSDGREITDEIRRLIIEEARSGSL